MQFNVNYSTLFMHWWKYFSCIFYYMFDKCVYIYLKIYLLIFFIIWLIIKINMDECDTLNELCTNTLVFTRFCNCKFPIKKIGKRCLRGANWIWCGAPPNLFSLIICTTSAQFWRNSTNNWTKEVRRCT
jgi:hypothetical protein